MKNDTTSQFQPPQNQSVLKPTPSQKSSSSFHSPQSTSSSPPPTPPPPPVLPTIEVGDSRFLGYAQSISNKSEAIDFRTSLRRKFPSAAHVSLSWVVIDPAAPSASIINSGFDEDGEPPNSTGPFLLQQTRRALLRHHSQRSQQQHSTGDTANSDNNPTTTNDCIDGISLVIVRFFGHRLLGVTCGRLSQCYASIARLTLHRYLYGATTPLVRVLSWDDPYVDENDGHDGNNDGRYDRSNDDDNTNDRTRRCSKYGLAAGDTEILIVPDLLRDHPHNVPSSDEAMEWVQYLASVIQFDGFRGETDQKLPRLQNLQADVLPPNPPPSSPSSPNHNNDPPPTPIYRYPGNYHGDEWQTYHWNPSVLSIRRRVERAIVSTSPSLYNTDGSVTFNHCVTNYYRSHGDFIGHHSDKDLDMDKKGSIVSVSLGEERVLELRRRGRPGDVTRVRLPHGSVLVLGYRTNREFTHSVVMEEEEERDGGEEGGDGRDDFSNQRISLTFRSVTTFKDRRTGRIFGDGALSGLKSIEEVRRAQWDREVLFIVVVGLMMGMVGWYKAWRCDEGTIAMVVIVVVGMAALSLVMFRRVCVAWDRRKEEKNAREFFSKTSVNGTKYS